jgi:hypothetical protein
MHIPVPLIFFAHSDLIPQTRCNPNLEMKVTEYCYKFTSYHLYESFKNPGYNYEYSLTTRLDELNECQLKLKNGMEYCLYVGLDDRFETKEVIKTEHGMDVNYVYFDGSSKSIHYS